MANALAANPWKLDTAGAISTGKIFIQTIHWVLPATTGDDLLIVDRDGNIIVEAKAETNLQSQIFRLEAWYAGLTLTTLDSGKVLVHIR